MAAALWNWGLGIACLAFLGLGMSFAMSGAMAQDFAVAKVLFAVAGISLAIPLVYQIWTFERLGYWRILLEGLGGAAIFSLIALGFVYAESRELRTLSELSPASSPDPETRSRCPAPPGAFWVHFAGGAAIINPDILPLTVLSLYGQEILTIDRRHGKLIVTALRIFDESGKRTFSITNDVPQKFDIGIDARKIDRSTLVVKDAQDSEVLRISYLNRNAIQVTGVFRYGTQPAVTVTETGLRRGGLFMSGFCAYNAGFAFEANNGLTIGTGLVEH